MNFEKKEKYSFSDLVNIMKLLRAPDGCPWDKVQTHQSIRQNFIEETYEAIEAIDTNDTELLKEELGDVLMQVVFHSEIESESGSFSIDDVCDGVCKKLIVRHPHVFSDVVADTPEKVLSNWDKIKMQTKSQKTGADVLDSVSKALPSLMRAQKLQHKAKKVGADTADLSTAFDRAQNSLDKLKATSSDTTADLQELFGKLLFSVVSISQFIDCDSEKALYEANDSFCDKFRALEQQCAKNSVAIGDATESELNSLWEEVNKCD